MGIFDGMKGPTPRVWPESKPEDGQHVVDYMNAVRDIQGHTAAQTESLKLIAARLNSIYEEIKVADYAETREDVTVYTGQAIPFHANGYRYNRIFVSDAAVSDTAKLVVSLGGISWTKTLVAGENTVDMPDGATYSGTTTSGKNFVAVLVRSNKE